MTRLQPRRASGWLLVVILACGPLGACGQGRVGSSRQPGLPTTRPPHANESTTSTAVTDDTGHDHDPGALAPARRAQLGLTGAGPAHTLTAPQWSDPQAVAAQWVLADTTYSSAEDPASVNTRRATFATAHLAAELATTSSGGARLEGLRERRARFTGEVLAVATSQAGADFAVIQITAAVTLTTSDQPPDRRVRFYRITLGRETGGRWLVARAEQS